MSDVVGVEALETAKMTANTMATTAAPGAPSVGGGTGVAAAGLVETRRPRAISKRVRKDILDAGWAMTESMLATKLARAGKMMVRVDAAHTSQGCSACGHVEKTNRQGKVFRCVACGHTMDADVNAGWNVRKRAIDILLGDKQNTASEQRQVVTRGATQTVVGAEKTGTVGRTGIAPGGSHEGSGEGRKRSSWARGATDVQTPAVDLLKKKPTARSAGSLGL